MSADNFVGVRPNKDGTYSVFEYGNMSMYSEDCMYLADQTGEISPSRETALVKAHDLVKEMYICEYGVVEMSSTRDNPCGRCFVCIHDRGAVSIPARRLRDEVARLEEYLPSSPERDQALSHLREQIRRTSGEVGGE